MKDRLQEAQWKLEGKCSECGKELLEHSPMDCDAAHKEFLNQMRIRAQDDVFAMMFDYAASNTNVQSQPDQDWKNL
jgi:hypothetical protein